MNQSASHDIPLGSTDSWLRPHLDAIHESKLAGFRFRHLPGFGNVLAVQGFRVWSGAMDVYIARAADDALAARFRLSDLDTGDPPAVWHQRGSVAEVVAELLALPAHGTPHAPRTAAKPVSGLWLP